MKLSRPSLLHCLAWIVFLTLLKSAVDLATHSTHSGQFRTTLNTIVSDERQSDAGTLKNQTINVRGAVNNHIEQSTESTMLNYIRRFQPFRISAAPFKVCAAHERPNASSIVWRKGVYQYHNWSVPPYGDHDTFILHHYFDDRFFTSHKQRFLRAPVVIRGPGPLRSKEGVSSMPADLRFQHFQHWH